MKSSDLGSRLLDGAEEQTRTLPSGIQISYAPDAKFTRGRLMAPTDDEVRSTHALEGTRPFAHKCDMRG